MKIYNKFLVITIILSIFLINIFFYINSRAFVSIYTIQPPSFDNINSALISGKSKVYKDHTNLNYYDKQVLDLLNKTLYSNILRFFQNNKTYRFSFAKESNLSESDKNLINLVLKNISLEGAYFLNPEYLSTVQISFYNLNLKEKKIFESYIDYIIEKEIDKSISIMDKSLSVSRDVILFFEENKKREKIFNKLIFFADNLLISKIKKNESLGVEEKNIEKNLNAINIFLKEIELGHNQSQKKIDEFKINLVNLFSNLEKKYFDLLSPVELLELQDLFIFSLKNYANEENKNILDKWVKELVIYKKISAVKDEPKIDKIILKKNIISNIKFQEKKFNFKEFISLNLFGITFSFAFYFIFINFKKKN